MGFSDIIFPLFLFIVGLSIPLSINVRISNGEKKRKIFKHIIQRSFALIVMGVFMVNYETASEYGMIISKYQWEIIMAISIFLIWINYKKIPYLNSKAEYFLKFLGTYRYFYYCRILHQLIYLCKHRIRTNILRLLNWIKFRRSK